MVSMADPLTVMPPRPGCARRPGGSISRAGVIGLIVAAVLLSGCAGSPSALDTKGPGAADIAALWWGMLTIALIVIVVVVGLLLFSVLRRRRGPETEVLRPERDRTGTLMIAVGGIAVPVVVLTGLMFFTVHTIRAVTDPGTPPALTVDVIGHDWWWEARYPDQGVVTANYIHIPAGRTIEVRLTSDDVIHSFWVPQLTGKTDLIPGQTNTLTLRADQPGTYRGQCAEYCGLQHAHMAFFVVADTADQFTTWLNAERAPAANPSAALAAQGQEVFLGHACSTCHAVRGTSANGNVGPDLTHLMSRPTIAAGTLETNRANIASWVLAPAAFKPGANMPPTTFDSASLDALLAYLESLK